LKLTNAEIMNSKEPLQELVKLKLPIKTSLALMKLVQKFNEHLVPAEEIKDRLVGEYGTDQGNGKMGIGPGDENWPKFMADYAELVAQEVEVDVEIVALPATVEISPADLMAIEKLVTVEAGP
jgi:hypothetical protein